MGADGPGGDLLWVGGGDPVVSRCSTTGYRPAPLQGAILLVWFPAVSLVESSQNDLLTASIHLAVGPSPTFAEQKS